VAPNAKVVVQSTMPPTPTNAEGSPSGGGL
jgi:hypothetical protein